MNNINFLSGNKFPMYREALVKMQEATNLVAHLAGLGGQTYILSGCVQNGQEISDGFVVINGELLPFVCSAIGPGKVSIQETRQDVNAFGELYPEIYVTRIARFAANGEYNWSDFKQILTNRELQQKIDGITGDKPGTVKMWAGNIAKIASDYKLCDGSLLSINDYPQLFENLGVSFGGDGINSFALPDLRSRFVVGYDSTDSEYNAISSSKVGGSKNVILSIDQIPAHKHAYTDDTNAIGKFPQIEDGFPQSIGGVSQSQSSGSSIGTGTVYNSQIVGGSKSHENRPPYFVLAYIIKIK